MKTKTFFLLGFFFISFQLLAVIKVACVGDSITEGVGSTSGQNYPAQLQQMLGRNYEVRNYGKSGRTVIRGTDSWLDTTPFLSQMYNWNPDVIVCMLGTNDSKTRFWNLKQYDENYHYLINNFLCFKIRPKIFLCTPPTCYSEGKLDTLSASVINNQIVAQVKTVFNAYNNVYPGYFKLIDIHSATSNMPGNFPDTVHPNNAGCKVIASTVKKYIDSRKSHEGQRTLTKAE